MPVNTMKNAAPRITLESVIEIFRLFKFANVNNKKNNANEPPASSKLLIIVLTLLFMGIQYAASISFFLNEKVIYTGYCQNNEKHNSADPGQHHDKVH